MRPHVEVNNMAEMKIPSWLRYLELLFGIIGIILGIMVIVYPLGLENYLLLLVLLLFGLLWLLRGFIFKECPFWLRLIYMIFGIIIIILGFLPLVLLTYPACWFFAIALILEGLFCWIITMFTICGFKGWIKWLAIIFGLIELVVAALVFVIVTISCYWLIAIAVVFSGLILLFKGIMVKQ